MKRNVARKQFGPTMLRAVWELDQGRCYYCGSHLDPFFDISIDHLIPLSRGGSNDLSNLALACRYCNSRKRDRDPEEYWEYLKGHAFELVQLLMSAMQALNEDGWPDLDPEKFDSGFEPLVEQVSAALRVAEKIIPRYAIVWPGERLRHSREFAARNAALESAADKGDGSDSIH